jgi:hypothetical protein
LYEEIKHQLNLNNQEWSKTINPLIAGVSARSTVVTLLMPIEYIRTNIQSRKAGSAVPDNM